MKGIIVLVLMIPILSLLAVANSYNFGEVKELIKNRISCDELTEDQLETIGDYYMEQMHPREAHEIMDKMMGGEGSESLRNIHTNIAESFYCGNSNAMSPGMMNMVGGGGYGMMANDFGYGMMGNWSPFGWGFGFISMLVFWGLIIWLIVWLIKTYSIKSESSSEILKKRYAKGEITKKQFEEMKREL